MSQGISAEMIADQWDLSRQDLDAFGARSQQFAARATAEGRFEREILPLTVQDDEGAATNEVIASDEGIRPDTTAEVLANLKPAFKPDGKVTAGNSSQISDGAVGGAHHERGEGERAGADSPGPRSTPSLWPAWTP